MIILSYILAFVQLTWQVDNCWFSPVLDDFFKFINIRPAYIKQWLGGMQGWGGWWKKKQEGTNS